MTIYLDCNATSPIEPEVHEQVIRFMRDEFGNAGSRTHEFGARAKEATEKARDQIANVVNSTRDEVIFTSGATESNNLAILGLAKYGREQNRLHIISTQIEHKAVLEPLEALRSQGFDITLLNSTSSGMINMDSLRAALRRDTLLVSVMHANNETGVKQPLLEVARILSDHPAFFHTDAAQGFGKDILSLQNKRIDLISLSGHKIYAPKGIGALVMRRRGGKRVPLSALLHGGGQERGLRPGTIPVALVVGLGLAAELAIKHGHARAKICEQFRIRLLEALSSLSPEINGDITNSLPHVVNLSFPGIDSESVMLALKDLVAISNGSACTSHKYEPSHVLECMGLTEERIQSALRWSWCHMTPEPDWSAVVRRIKRLI